MLRVQMPVQAQFEESHMCFSTPVQQMGRLRVRIRNRSRNRVRSRSRVRSRVRNSVRSSVRSRVRNRVIMRSHVGLIVRH